MSTLEVLNEKLMTLQSDFVKFLNGQKEKIDEIDLQIKVISECANAIEDDKAFTSFDFNDAIKLVAAYNYNIANITNVINDIQNVFAIRQELNLSNDDMPLEESQTNNFKLFMDDLVQLRKILKDKKDSLELAITKQKQHINNLENLKNILEGRGKRKYVTTDMFESFYKEFDILSMDPIEAKELLEGFYKTKNLTRHLNKQKVDFKDVLNLYSRYLESSSMQIFEQLLAEHQSEVVFNIDLDNTEEILSFFKKQGILNNFKRTALLKISLYGDIDYIKNDIYPKIIADRDNMDAYYKDELASIWVKEKKASYHVKSFRVSKNLKEYGTLENLFSSCHTVNYDELLDNINLLKANQHLFDPSIDFSDLGSNLRLKTLPEWVLKKNIGLCNLFALDTLNYVPISCIEHGDIEDKIHLAIELGLLNPPMTYKFLEMDKSIVRNKEFQKNISKRHISNQSIRNYFQRYLSTLSLRSINEYAYLFYKLQKMGYVDFYNDFFSDSHAGKGSVNFLTDLEKELITDKNAMDNLVSSNFMIDWYADFINNYDEYDSTINEYNEQSKKEGNFEYFNQNILNDALISKLESNNAVMDIILEDGQKLNKKNNYVYLFGSTIISRYKVLKNASILKEAYGHLNKDMLLTSILRNSFLDENAFELIHSEVMERGKSL